MATWRAKHDIRAEHADGRARELSKFFAGRGCTVLYGSRVTLFILFIGVCAIF